MERKEKMSFWERKWVFPALFLLTGVLSGFVGGTLGAGGGVILVFALGELLPRYAKSSHGEAPPFDRRDVFAMTVVVTLASSSLSAALYMKNGALDIRDALRFLPGAAVGGIAGGLMLGRFSSDTVRWIFAVITAVAGGIMLFL